MNFNKRGLGKGLDALLATSNVAQAKKQQKSFFYYILYHYMSFLTSKTYFLQQNSLYNN